MKVTTIEIHNLGPHPLIMTELRGVGPLRNGAKFRVSDSKLDELKGSYGQWIKVEAPFETVGDKTLKNGDWEMLGGGGGKAAPKSEEPTSEMKADKSMANKSKVKKKVVEAQKPQSP